MISLTKERKNGIILPSNSENYGEDYFPVRQFLCPSYSYKETTKLLFGFASMMIIMIIINDNEMIRETNDNISNDDDDDDDSENDYHKQCLHEIKRHLPLEVLQKTVKCGFHTFVPCFYTCRMRGIYETVMSYP
jgi:hypothetical protein